MVSVVDEVVLFRVRAFLFCFLGWKIDLGDLDVNGGNVRFRL